jgi:vacuolar-type H+-ATPase subunit H
MKKILKIFAIILAVLLVLLIVTPIFFKKPIENLVKGEINKTVNAKVDFSNFKLSFIRGFPNVYIALENLSVVGTGVFEKDTLLAFKTFSVKVDLISAIKMENIKVKSVFLDHPRISAKVLKNGKANWDIMKPDTAAVAPKDTAQGKPLDFHANLKKFEIAHAYIKYQDSTSNMSAEIKDFNFLLSGNFSAKTTDMKINTSIESIDYVMGGIKYLKRAKFRLIAQLGADLENAIYTIKDNEIKLNELSLSLAGVVKMPKDAMDIDMKFKTNKADFKTLLSMVPAVYMKDFSTVQTVGNLKLDGYVKGIYAGKKMPNAGINLVVENAMFRYPALPKSVNNININMNLFFDGIQNDNSTVDINKFHFEMAGNPFDINLHIKTPISDMNIVGNFTGKIDFSSVSDIVPVDSLTLKGMLECNVDIMGQMSSIKKGKYEDFKADGTIKLENFEFANRDFRQGVKILTAKMAFSPKYVELSSFDSRIGRSDVQLSGKLEKFIPYVFSKDTIQGSLNFASKLLDLNEFMTGESTPAQPTAKDSTQLTVFEVPGNIDFTLNSKIGQLNYDKLKINDLSGIIIVRNSKAILKNLNMNLLEGSMVINGEYNTQDIKNPTFNFNLNMKDIDIPQAYTAFNTVAKLAPVAQNCKGRMSADINIASSLDQHMMPVYNSMVGKGRLMSKSIEIGNSNMFVKIADVLKNDRFRKLTLNNLDLKFEIKNGRVYVNPFDTKFGTSKMTISGDQGIDQTINYLLKVAIPRSEFGGAANDVLNNLAASAAAKGLNIKPGENVNIDIFVLGTVLKPEVKPVIAGSGKDAVQDMKTQVKEAAVQKVEEVKRDVKKQAKEQADKIMKDAEAEAQKARDLAKAGADAARNEANAVADRGVSEAKGPIQKELAKKAAEKVRKEGDNKANKILQEGNAKADAIINKAKTEAAAKLQ